MWSFHFSAIYSKKGWPLMVSSASLPWYNAPARRFPAKVWLEERYSFRIPPLRFTQRRQPGRRAFPAQVWLAEQRAGG